MLRTRTAALQVLPSRGGAKQCGRRHLSRNGYLRRKCKQLHERALQGQQTYNQLFERDNVPAPGADTAFERVDPALVPLGLRYASLVTHNSRPASPELALLRDWTRRDGSTSGRYVDSPAAEAPDIASIERLAAVWQREGAAGVQARLPADLLKQVRKSRRYYGVLHALKVPHFGRIRVVHEQPRKVSCDRLLLPLPCNALPTHGPTLEVLELGGAALIENLYGKIGAHLRRRVQALKAVEKTYSDPDRGGSPAQFAAMVSEAGKLRPGKVVWVPDAPNGVAAARAAVGFCVMPADFYTPGAVSKYTYRAAVRDVLNEVWRGEGPPPPGQEALERSSACVAFLGRTECRGFDVRHAARTFFEELFDAFLQLDFQNPYYSIDSVVVASPYYSDARALADALEDQARRWLPEHRVVSAAAYFYRRSRRVLRIPPDHFRMFSGKAKFENYTNPRRRRGRYRRDVKPFLFRRAVVGAALKQLVNPVTGAPAGAALPLKAPVGLGAPDAPESRLRRLQVAGGRLVGRAKRPHPHIDD